MSNLETEYVKKFDELQTVVRNLTSVVEVLPRTFSGINKRQLESEDLDFIEGILDDASKAFDQSKEYLAWRNRPSVYGRIEAILADAAKRKSRD